MNYTDFSEDERKFYLSESGFDSREKEFFRLRVYPMRRKTPCFGYGDIRRVHRIYASN